MSTPESTEVLPEDGYAGGLAEAVVVPETHTPMPAHPLEGLVLLLSALFFFACMDTTAKFLAASYPVPLIMAVRYVVNLGLMVALLAPRQGWQLLETRRTGLVVLRGLSLVGASLFVGLALQRMPVAETTAFIFLGPMLVVLMARPLLGEHIGLLGWIAVLSGLAGVLLIARPSGGLDGAGLAFALCGAVANAIYQLLSRLLSTTERTVALLFYSALVGSVCFGLCLPWFAQGAPPSLKQIALFVSLGVYGGFGHYLFTAAFRHAPASLLAPVNYLQMLWAGLLGWVVFGHVPDGMTLAGMCVVAASGVMIAVKTHRAHFRKPS